MAISPCGNQALWDYHLRSLMDGEGQSAGQPRMTREVSVSLPLVLPPEQPSDDGA